MINLGSFLNNARNPKAIKATFSKVDYSVSRKSCKSLRKRQTRIGNGQRLWTGNSQKRKCKWAVIIS